MGHTKCGAVTGALNHLRSNNGVIDVQQGHLNAVLIPIEIAIVEAGINIYAPNALEQSIRANIRYQANQLISQSPLIAAEIAEGKLTIIGAEYHLATGKVKQLFSIP
jgi:carbonic anhydrase